MLYLIGLGLDSIKDVSVKGLEAIKTCNKIYLEAYTSKLLNFSIEEMENYYGKKIIIADRNLVEKECEDTILKDASNSNVALLVVGDPFGATTHTDIFLRAKEMKIECKIIHNVSILNAIGSTGLELYKFGKTTSIPYPQPSFFPKTAYDVIKQNKSIGLHTLCLLDIKADKNKFMTINEAIEILFQIEDEKKEQIFTKETFCVACARLGSDSMMIKSGKAKDVLKKDLGKPLHCLIVPGNMHFIEEDMLKMWNKEK
jgi:diphthine synthase